MVESDIHHELFPVTLSGSWGSEQSVQLSNTLKDWLIDRNSLTQRLKSQYQHFRVELLGQKIEPCSIDDANGDIKQGQQVLIREVLLVCNDQPHVFARSVLPLSSLTGEQKALASLGNQSLGQVLFNHPHLIRKNIDVASFNRESSVAAIAQYYHQDFKEHLWGRRSTFVIDNKPIIVAEVFLPIAAAYQMVT